jgi:signal transduction histidine kinase
MPERILVDQQDDLWVATYGGVYRRSVAESAKAAEWQLVLPDRASAVFEDRTGSIWVGGPTGLARFKRAPAGGWSAAERLAIRDVVTIAEDREGSLWIGTHDGLHRLKDVNVTAWTADEGLLSNDTPSVVESADGSLFVFSTTPSGATRLKDGTLTQFTNLNDGPSHAARDGSLWVGSLGAISRLHDGRVDRFDAKDGVPAKWISAIAEDDEGLILCLASYGGLCRWSPGRARPLVLADGSEFKVPFHVMTTHWQKDGTLWFAGYDGLWRLQRGNLTRFTTPEGVAAMQPWLDIHPGTATYTHTEVTTRLSDRVIASIAEDSDGTLWFASSRGGLTRLSHGQFTPYSAANGLLSNQLFCVLVDDTHDVWLSSPRGIFRVRAAELDAVAQGRASTVSCRVFTTADGMKNEECVNQYQPAGWKRRDGTLWFGTRHGIAVIDPSRLESNPLPPPVVIEGVTTDGIPASVTPALELPAGVNNLEIRYTALSLLAPERVGFRYRLTGYDQDWIEARTSRAAHYTKLPPGPYEFRVTACNNDGVWATEPATFTFRLRPYFYQTGWFIVMSALAVATGVFAVHRARVLQLQRRDRELQRRVDSRTAELRKANAELLRQIEQRKRAEQEIERVNSALVAASRHAGMAEVATGVLHNVGNVLNSVNVSTTVALDHLRQSRAGNVKKAAVLLTEHADDLPGFLLDDPRGRQLPDYLQSLGDALAVEQATIAHELADVRRNINHIKEIVATQQNYARLGGACEPVPLLEIVRSALAMNQETFATHGIRLVSNLGDDFVIVTERHKVLQILVNLLRNAKDACDEATAEHNEVSVRVERNTDHVVITVEDNGVGIPAENLVRIFSHGFTTKKHGHGFGLHSSALAAKELGGALTAHSRGTGQGATFRLTLPFNPPQP